MRDEDDWVMLSALEHYAYCPRQCGLIHIEQVFEENVFTLRGRQAHERAHDSESSDSSGGVRSERSLPLWCDRLGVYGVADVVEFHPDGAVYPVEYKSGPRRRRGHDDVQLCAQAMCLEEMLGVAVPRGAIYSAQSRRRREVALDARLRETTEEVIVRTREMLRSGALPAPANDARCPNCSLIDACLPGTLVAARVARFDPFRIPPGENGDDPPRRGKER
jgi:CRISPR-associated exonuclease Cas4